MKVLVDTCVWSRVLRCDKPDLALSKEMNDLVFDNRVVLIGPIYQEILSGIKNKKDFNALKEQLAAFDFLRITEEIYVKAAEYFNICKSQGLNGGHTDFLICAVAAHYDSALLTVDSDFKNFKKYLPINLLSQ